MSDPGDTGYTRREDMKGEIRRVQRPIWREREGLGGGGGNTGQANQEEGAHKEKKNNWKHTS